jgi:3-oxoadipate enol-lactonase
MTDKHDLINQSKVFNSRIKRIKCDELELEYLLTGSEKDETILFVHSLGANLKQFWPNAFFFKDSYRVLCISLRGHGKSARPFPEYSETYSMSSYMNDIKCLLDTLGIKKIHYVGNSMGGLLGYYFLRYYPEYLISLTTLASVVELKLFSLLVPFLAGLNYQIYKFQGRIRYEKWIADVASKSTYCKAFMLEEMVKDLNPEAIYHSQKNIQKFSFLDELEKTNIPVLMIKGELDSGINFITRYGEKYLKNYSTCRLKELKGAGHLGNLDQIDAFNRLLKEFYEEVGCGQRA